MCFINTNNGYTDLGLIERLNGALNMCKAHVQSICRCLSHYGKSITIMNSNSAVRAATSRKCIAKERNYCQVRTECTN